MRKKSLTRRQFARQGAALAAAMSVSPVALVSGDHPAVLGGKPLHAGGWPNWPLTDAEEEAALKQVLRSGAWYRYAGSDSPVSVFEERWASTTGSAYCQTTSSGTAALITALAALEIGPGDEVLLPPYTFIATVNAVLLHHALPVFVDSDPQTAQIDVAQIESRISAATRCIVPVHLGGASCDIDRLLEIARRRRLHIVEDSCQTHTGEWKGKRLGTFGDAGCYSFQNSKNLTSGEGGAVVSQDEALYRRAQAYQHNGGSALADDDRLTGNGCNFRLTNFQGALLLPQLERLDRQSQQREANAARLDALLSEIGGVKPKKKLPGLTRHGYHLYVFDYDPEAFAGMDKKRFSAALQAEGIPVSGGYSATNKMPWVDRLLSSRGFLRIYGKNRLDRWRNENQLPANDRMIETTCWMSQNVLLADPVQIQLIADAVSRVKQHAAEIARAAS